MWVERGRKLGEGGGGSLRREVEGEEESESESEPKRSMFVRDLLFREDFNRSSTLRALGAKRRVRMDAHGRSWTLIDYDP